MAEVICNGIDVSYHQAKIDWNKVKASGVKFAILRAGLGKSTIDKQFVRNITECNRLEIPVGVYWFSYALNTEQAAGEAAACLKAIKPYRVEYPVYFDLEYDTDRYMKQNGVTLTKTVATNHARAFLAAIEEAGYYAGLYANPDYLNRFFDASLLNQYDLWLANYKQNADTTNPPRSCGMWQHWSKGSISGISGNVDLNACYKDYPTIIQKAGLNGLAAQDGWLQDGNAWYWYENGQPVKSAWRKITGVNGTFWYFLGANGIMLTGTQKIGGKVYHLNEKAACGLPEGALVVTDEDGVVQFK